MSTVVTFDLFSALIDSRRGGSALLGRLAEKRGWAPSGTDVYDVWDAENKRLQRTARPPVTFHDLSRTALHLAYRRLRLPLDRVDDDTTLLEHSVADWPLWPDVPDGLRMVVERAGIGILSNVDDELVRTTRAYPLVDPDLVLTSQALAAYKPHPAVYLTAARRVAPRRIVHVAASARDVRGALEAGIDTIRIVRPGHVLDPAGPVPEHQIETVGALLAVL